MFGGSQCLGVIQGVSLDILVVAEWVPSKILAISYRLSVLINILFREIQRHSSGKKGRKETFKEARERSSRTLKERESKKGRKEERKNLRRQDRFLRS